MGKPIVVNQDGLRVLIDPDDRSRKPSEVITYMLSPEEIAARYPNTGGVGNKTCVTFYNSKTERMSYMRETKITTDQLVKECKELGFTMEAYTDIAKRYGFSSAQTVASHVSKRNIKQLIKNETVPESVSKPAEENLQENISAAPKDNAPADELEILNKIKDILRENKSLKAAAEANAALKEFLIQQKAAIEEIIKIIS